MQLQFEPFQSALSQSFWAALTKLKLDVLGLSEAEVPVHGRYSRGRLDRAGAPVPPTLHIDEAGLAPAPQGTVLAGKLKLFNTLEAYRAFDKLAWLNGYRVADAAEPDFYIVAFADLKRYRYHYHVCLPSAFNAAAPIEVEPIGHPPVELEGASRLQADTLVVADASCHDRVAGWNTRLQLLRHRPARLVLVRQAAQHAYAVTSLPSAESLQMCGWEMTAAGGSGRKTVDLAALLDPVRLAEDAAALNLKLIKWRILPALDLGALARARCLLVGAGTLGCNVTRALLAYGVRKVTLIDSGTVSFSNPVRQSLFVHADCLGGGAPKAEAAARMAMAICPYADVQGLQMAIPMPGHLVTDDAEFATAVAELDRLVQAHDVVFLLTDSRESRWLPALLGAAHDKLVMTVALGFDSFVAMRHGTPASGLGCYFCHDINSPTDTLSGRTLDQQCTVTRVGLSGMASSTAVELMASVLQHPMQHHAKATPPVSPSEPVPSGSSVLGTVPHQVRGFLTHFQNVILAGERFSCCPACSDSAVGAYRAAGADFVRRAITDAGYLETVTGLLELKQLEQGKLEAFMDDLEIADDF